MPSRELADMLNKRTNRQPSRKSGVARPDAPRQLRVRGWLREGVVASMGGAFVRLVRDVHARRQPLQLVEQCRLRLFEVLQAACSHVEVRLEREHVDDVEHLLIDQSIEDLPLCALGVEFEHHKIVPSERCPHPRHDVDHANEVLVFPHVATPPLEVDAALLLGAPVIARHRATPDQLLRDARDAHPSVPYAHRRGHKGEARRRGRGRRAHGGLGQAPLHQHRRVEPRLRAERLQRLLEPAEHAQKLLLLDAARRAAVRLVVLLEVLARARPRQAGRRLFGLAVEPRREAVGKRLDQRARLKAEDLPAVAVRRRHAARDDVRIEPERVAPVDAHVDVDAPRAAS
mmetsp:Transcript_67612/g.179883  ORF Transcript_67612/g.179883 Transcript_67612/m.179883 type:complete len:344 (+) Transcript_67612:57-1088(+)|eukprot:1352516-Prymnesium_polylepis.1